MRNRSSTWRKSSYSNGAGGDCVEVKPVGVSVLIRDSKYLRDPANDPAAQPMLAIPARMWPIFLDAAGNGGPSVAPGLPVVSRAATGTTLTGSEGTVLSYTPAEWDAFVAGIAAGEFALDTVLAA